MTTTSELTQKQVQRLAEDAVCVAAAILIYVPPHQKRAHAAAGRILRRMKLGHLVAKRRVIRTARGGEK